MTCSACIFTFPRDYGVAMVATAFLQRLGTPVTWVIDKDDQMPDHMPPCPVIRSFSRRNGNLNGRVWVSEQLDIMHSVAHGGEWAVKVDSDTMVLSMDWLRAARDEHGAVGMIIDPGDSRVFFGMCYAVRTHLLPGMAASIPAHQPNTLPLQEDLMVGVLAAPHGVLRHRREMWTTWDGTGDPGKRIGGKDVVLALPVNSRISTLDIANKLWSAANTSPTPT